ncbi:translation initiation factor eIF-2B subunit delta, putative [Babesia ovis]|uniref:Translation initiation factor eIF-2B subunit delta, putative n=1 Tax=Babesia ovis TaxID=5869 RepID=A0A9W5TCV3_BABOV|nr:translation initiation factor eIF-2B subunit delta, putative [Babesia ovis]
MSTEHSSTDDAHSTVMCKRPLFVLNKSHNEIYITSRVPLCVYYDRAISLLRWQLSRFPDLCSDRFARENHLNKTTGILGNRAKLLLQHMDSSTVSCDPASVSAALSKHHEHITGGSGVILYGTGSCVNRALYVLQDIYEYVKKLYVESQSRFRGRSVRVLCDQCSSTAQSSTEGRAKHSLEDPCSSCDASTNAALEAIVKRILRVNISTGSVQCHDDVYSYSVQDNPLPSTSGSFCPLDSLDTSVQVSRRERMISSIRISICVGGK